LNIKIFDKLGDLAIEKFGIKEFDYDEKLQDYGLETYSFSHFGIR